jgi:hypothetical protein
MEVKLGRAKAVIGNQSVSNQLIEEDAKTDSLFTDLLITAYCSHHLLPGFTAGTCARSGGSLSG